LKKKKYRDQAGLFIAEGPKVINELIAEGLQIHNIFATDESVGFKNATVISQTELQKISCLSTANSCLAVFKIPKKELTEDSGLIVALDAVRDPGNLGTIIRLCDWFGVTQLICSMDTADCYNPKVIQATMGSIARVEIQYLNLVSYLKNTKSPIFGGVMDGTNVYTQKLPENAIMVLGNEANGISEAIENLLTHRISIPQFGKNQATESLNVATATAILLSECKRSTGR